MDINEYITSGIIEQYVLGSVSPQERQEVECMAKIYPEINTHLSDLQGSIEKMVTQVAQPAPIEVKNRIMAEIAKTPQDAAEPPTAKVISMSPSGKSDSSGSNRMRYVAAACLVGFTLAAGMALYQSNRKAALKNQMANSQKELIQAQEKIVSMEESMLYNSEQLAFIAEKETQKINLAGTKGYELSEASVYWNPKNQKVMLDHGQLASLPEGKQYQLWAIADGVPVDMGMIDKGKINRRLAEMKTTGKAQAFAITIEPKGGSKSPTMEAMVVLGEV